MKVVPPGQPEHLFDYNEVDDQIEYQPPILPTIPQPQTEYVWNLDKQLTQMIRPDGQTVLFDYDASPRRMR